ncbi:hypothetical protein B0A55_06905 [Friedmanniomyces simplex]|uniref:Uncharacterized protein n=1 Tax=Friedmanniomyces simplex TaxID=329884 RepID=A0A4U0X4M5_9PEZI|nr:hypothetical protein B0A55_06905 [Friedmanniomyces simplex]
MEALTKVYRDQPKTVLFTAAAAIRILAALLFPALPDLLTLRAELSTPVNSFKRSETVQYRKVYSSMSEDSTHTMAAYSTSHACQAQATTAAFAVALAGHTSLHPVMLLPPIGLLCYDRVCVQSAEKGQTSETDGAIADSTKTNVAVDLRSQPQPLQFGLRFVATFICAEAFLFGFSRLILPSWRFIPSIYMTLLELPDLTPNAGLWWYFFIEMFDAFRSFFLGVFWLHMLSYSVPFCLRFQRQPLAAVVLMMGIIAVFEPYANAGDAGAWLSCLCLLGHLFELTSLHRYTFPAIATLLYSTLLGPAFHHLWIYAGSGNANFFYAITLVWSLALLILLTDTVYAALRDEWEAERPEGKGKEIRQM